MKCPTCNLDMKQVKFDVSYGTGVDSLHCDKYGFNITDDKLLNKAIASLKEWMAKEVKVIGVGTGIEDKIFKWCC